MLHTSNETISPLPLRAGVTSYSFSKCFYNLNRVGYENILPDQREREEYYSKRELPVL